MNPYNGPEDGDYASYVEKLGTAEPGRASTDAAQAAPGSAAAGGATPPPIAPARSPANPQAPGAPARGIAPGGRTSGSQQTRGQPQPGMAPPPPQQTPPPARAPRLIGTLLLIAAWVLFFLSLKLGIQAWHTKPASIDNWIPAGFTLIAARLLLAMGKAARNPRVRPQDPAKSFPEHIEY